MDVLKGIFEKSGMPFIIVGKSSMKLVGANLFKKAFHNLMTCKKA